MKIFRNKSLTGVAIVAPLLMAVGCAGDRQNIAQTENMIEQRQQEMHEHVPATEVAISNMDGYLEQLPKEAVMVVPGDIETVVENVVQNEAEEISLGSMTDEELLVAEVLGVGPSLIKEQEQDDARLIMPPPEQLVIQFGFDEYVLAENDRKLVKDHAEYLLQNQNYVLVISGHTDNRGPELYNQKLSEQRAQAVAELLVAAGVPVSQLQVTGLAGAVPRVSPDNWQENRRVEFVYQDSMLANN